MDFTRITPDFAIGGQITVADVAQVYSLGFKSIICNRPDGEDISQPLFEDIEAAAATTGLAVSYVPVPPNGPDDTHVANFVQAYDALPKPILAYCRTGGRSKTIYEQALANR